MRDEKIAESFAKIKEDMQKRIYEIQELNRKVDRLQALFERELSKLKSSGSNSELVSVIREEIRNSLRNIPLDNNLGYEYLRKVERNKKDIIKHKILELIPPSGIDLAELKEIIVDQRRYCSKASFYRYYNELRPNLLEVKDGNKNIVKKNAGFYQYNSL